MTVSIILITYNHEAYIDQCLDGLLMQQCDFNIQVVVADDASTDDTFTIISHRLRHASFETVWLPRDRNIGFVKNYQRAFKACSGRYVAVLEGDDYWTDPQRLAKHVQFLEAQKTCVLSMNRFEIFNQATQHFSITDWYRAGAVEYITSQQLAGGNRLGNLSSCVFRKSALDKLRPDFFDLTVSDWMLGIQLGAYGTIAILKTPMSVYRKHAKGQWSALGTEVQNKELLRLIEDYDRYLNYQYTEAFQSCKKKLVKHGSTVHHTAAANTPLSALKSIFKSLMHLKPSGNRNEKQ